MAILTSSSITSALIIPSAQFLDKCREALVNSGPTVKFVRSLHKLNVTFWASTISYGSKTLNIPNADEETENLMKSKIEKPNLVITKDTLKDN